jgi:hypothetical protein
VRFLKSSRIMIVVYVIEEVDLSRFQFLPLFDVLPEYIMVA